MLAQVVVFVVVNVIAALVVAELEGDPLLWIPIAFAIVFLSLIYSRLRRVVRAIVGRLPGRRRRLGKERSERT